MKHKWNSPEGQAFFKDWLYGQPQDIFDDFAEPREIKELTVAAAAFLRRRNAILHSFSHTAVQTVRGISKLQSVSLGRNPDLDTFTFTRTYEPRQTRIPLRDVELEDGSPYEPLDDIIGSIQETDYAMEIRQDVFHGSMYLEDNSRTTRLPLTGSDMPVVRWPNEFNVEDFMVLRTIMHNEPHQRQG